MWGKDQENCFTFVKRLFKCDKLSRLFDPTLETDLECDASTYGIGSVLIQKHADAWHLVQFASRTLNSAEQNYSQIERAALSVLFGCERF